MIIYYFMRVNKNTQHLIDLKGWIIRYCIVPQTSPTITLPHPLLHSSYGWVRALYYQQAWDLSTYLHLNILCHIHYSLRTEHQFWCVTANCPFSRVYMGTGALWIHCCSRLKKFHKALSESDNWFMQQIGWYMEPYHQIKFSETHKLMPQQKNFARKWANHCRKIDNFECPPGIAKTFFATFFLKACIIRRNNL